MSRYRFRIRLLLLLSLLTPVGESWAKPNFTKELGMKSCLECHDRANIKAPTDYPLYLKAKEMRQKLRKGEGEFKDVTTCYDCHQGHKLGN